MLALPQAVSPMTGDIFIFFLTTLYSVLKNSFDTWYSIVCGQSNELYILCMWNRKMPNSWEQRVEW